MYRLLFSINKEAALYIVTSELTYSKTIELSLLITEKSFVSYIPDMFKYATEK